jgi:hypothetical protein
MIAANKNQSRVSPGAGVTPQIPVYDQSIREDRTVSRRDFRFDRERNVYVCSAGMLLTTTGNVGDDHALRYHASKRNCDTCPLKLRAPGDRDQLFRLIATRRSD